MSDVAMSVKDCQAHRISIPNTSIRISSDVPGTDNCRPILETKQFLHPPRPSIVGISSPEAEMAIRPFSFIRI